MTNFKELIEKEVEKQANEISGYKKFPRARFDFTKERAEEFARTPVETLIDDPYFLGLKWSGKRGIWPKNKEIVLGFFEERKKRCINTFLYTGAIGIGKGFVSAALTFLQVFELLIIPDISDYYSLDKGSTYCFAVLSKDADKAKRVTFRKKLKIFASSPFFQDYFPLNIDAEKIMNNPRVYPRELRLPKDIVIFPGSGAAAAALGFDLAGGDMDEINDMERVEKSKKLSSKDYYDAAEEAYREILERMNSRFPWQILHEQGKKHGFVSIMGQTRFPDSFTERLIRESEVLGKDSTVYWVRLPRWEAQDFRYKNREKFLFDVTNKRIITFYSIKERPDLYTEKCNICGQFLIKGGFIGNKGKLVCSIDCYSESYASLVDVVKES